jgi:eukaryotic-like serine/threonine-protein kinase
MAQPSAAAGRLAEGTIFGHYEIVRHLGSGGMGSVYQAVHAKLGKQVALKTLLPQYASHSEAQARFLREGKLAAKLRHPHVVDVTDFGIEEGIPYLVMEFLEGEDLSTALARVGRLFPEQISDLLLPVTAALASAHDQQIIHRDLKPQNIFLARSGSGEPTPKILDFGISKLLNDSEAGQLTGSMNLLGTPAYMSPEQARSSKYIDARSDQYTMAVIAYCCVTGRMPFAGESVYALIREVVEGEFARPSEIVEGIPPEFEAVILRGMSRQPDERYPTTWDFGAALLPFASVRTQVLWEPQLRRSASPFTPAPMGAESSSRELRPITGAPSGRSRLEPSHRDLPGGSEGLEATVTPPAVSEDPGGHPTELRQSAQRGSGSPTDRSRSQAGEDVRPAPSRVPRWAIASGVVISAMALVAVGTQLAAPPPAPLVVRATATPTSPVNPAPAGAPPASSLTPPARTPPTTYRAEVTVHPPDAEIELDGHVVGKGAFVAELPKDGRAHALAFHRSGYEALEVAFQDMAPPRGVTLSPLSKHKAGSSGSSPPAVQAPAPSAIPAPAPAVVGSGNLVVTTKVDGTATWADVRIDGVAVGRTPLTRKDLSVGQHRIDLSRPDSTPKQVTAEIRAGETTKLIEELTH